MKTNRIEAGKQFRINILKDKATTPEYMVLTIVKVFKNGRVDVVDSSGEQYSYKKDELSKDFFEDVHSEKEIEEAKETLTRMLRDRWTHFIEEVYETEAELCRKLRDLADKGSIHFVHELSGKGEEWTKHAEYMSVLNRAAQYKINDNEAVDLTDTANADLDHVCGFVKTIVAEFTETVLSDARRPSTSTNPWSNLCAAATLSTRAELVQTQRRSMGWSYLVHVIERYERLVKHNDITAMHV